MLSIHKLKSHALHTVVIGNCNYEIQRTSVQASGIAILLTSIAFWCLSITNSLATEKLTNTVAGEFKYSLNETTSVCNIELNNNSILKFKCDYDYLPKIAGHFKGKIGTFSELIVLQERPMGNACNGGPLHIIGLRENKSFHISGPLDFCGGKSPIIKQTGEIITITFPGGPPNRGEGIIPTENWTYRDGHLKKIQ